MNIFELYKKCIKGECSPEEAVLVESWLKEHPDAFEGEMLSEIQEMETGNPMPDLFRQGMLAHFRGLGLSEPETRRASVVKMAGKRIFRWVAAAAIIGLLVTGAWLFGVRKGEEKKVEWARIGNDGHGVRLVMLPDSSKIWLNTGALIRYRIGDDQQVDREIELTGEAYFAVRTQAGRSFTVKAGSTRTRVLGTEFNIEAYPDEAMVRVSLRTGKVQVSSLDEKGGTKDCKLLEPGQAAVFHKGESLLSVMPTPLATPQAWIGDALVLNDVSLEVVFARIGRKYNKRILFDVVQAKRYGHIKASYNKPGIDQVLTQLGFTCDFHFKKDSNTYTISFEKDRAH